MAQSRRNTLRQLLVAGYDDLKHRLARRLGSLESATEVLNETWLRLDGQKDVSLIREPSSYLYRMALNVAVDRQRANARWQGRAQIAAWLHADEEHHDPERIVSARSEIAELERALAELPSRRRAIFIAALVEELPYRDIAVRFGVSLRSVEREIARAFDHCSVKCGNAFVREAEARDVNKTETARANSADDAHDD